MSNDNDRYVVKHEKGWAVKGAGQKQVEYLIVKAMQNNPLKQ